MKIVVALLANDVPKGKTLSKIFHIVFRILCVPKASIAVCKPKISFSVRGTIKKRKHCDCDTS